MNEFPEGLITVAQQSDDTIDIIGRLFAKARTMTPVMAATAEDLRTSVLDDMDMSFAAHYADKF